MPPENRKSEGPKDQDSLRNCCRHRSKKDVPWANYSDRKRKLALRQNIYRIGPAPKDEWEDKIGKTRSKPDHIGNLDCSDMEQELEDVENNYLVKRKQSSTVSALKRNISAGSQAIVIYFSRLAKKTSSERVDYNFLHSLIRNGAEVNVSDKYGQTVFHEVARNWNVDVARFLMNYGGSINQADKYGRTPLHLAVASNHTEMVDYLLRSGANPSARTYGESQTVIHFAAKYNAVGSLKVLIEHKVDYNVKDYKGRTPLFVAAEMGRIDSARYLLDIGVAVGVFDDTGMSCIGFMIEKMPHVAYEALNQFYNSDVGRRKDYFYLNYLDGNPSKWMVDNNMDDSGYDLWEEKSLPTEKELKEKQRLACPTTPLELAVRRRELKVIMHPAMQQLIKTKWDLYGKYGASATFLFHLTYVIIWTVLAVTLPRDGIFYSNGDIYWRLPLETFNVILTFYFIVNIVWKNKIEFKCTQRFGVWIRRQINRDLQFCHPRWSQEKTFLENELDALSSERATVVRLEYPWNILEIPTFLSVFLVIITRIVSIHMNTKSVVSFHYKSMVFALIFIWLYFMKSCRPFTTLGIFITLLGYALKETVTFAGIFFIFCVPYAIGFWVLFGNRINSVGGDPDDPDNEWNSFNDILFFTWQVTVNVKFDKESIMIDDRIMSQMMLGTFYAVLTMLMVNLYIALLTETFNKVYANAKAHASREQANTILNVEKLLSKNIKKKADEFIQDFCGPLETHMEESEAGVTDEELWTNVCRAILRRLGTLRDIVTAYYSKPKKKQNVQEELAKKFEDDTQEYELYQGILARDKELFTLQQDLYDMKCTAMKILNPDSVLPEKPKYVPLPLLDIKKPELPVILKKETNKNPSTIEVDDNNKKDNVFNIEDMYAKVNKKTNLEKREEKETENSDFFMSEGVNTTNYSTQSTFNSNTQTRPSSSVIDNEKLPGYDHRITALMDARIAYFNNCIPNSNVRPVRYIFSTKNMEEISRVTHSNYEPNVGPVRYIIPTKHIEEQSKLTHSNYEPNDRMQKKLTEHFDSAKNEPLINQPSNDSQIYSEIDNNCNLESASSFTSYSNPEELIRLNWVYPNNTSSSLATNNENELSLDRNTVSPQRSIRDIPSSSKFNTHLYSHVSDEILMDTLAPLDQSELNIIDDTDETYLLPDSSDTLQPSLPTIGENTISNATTVETDNALFRTIMNIKTARMRYRIEPNRQNIHRILSLINEEEKGLFVERKSLR